MKLLYRGFLLLCIFPAFICSMEVENQDQSQPGITEQQHAILKVFFGKKQSAIGRFTAELGKPWQEENTIAWLDAQLQKRLKEYNKQRKHIALKAFAGMSASGISGYLCLANKIVKPEIQVAALGLSVTGAAYCLSNLYDYLALVYPTTDLVVQEIQQKTLTYTDHEWRAALLNEIECKNLANKGKNN